MEGLFGDVPDDREGIDTRVVEQDIQPPEMCLDLLEYPADVRRLGNAALNGNSIASARDDGRDNFFGGFFTAGIIDDYGCAFFGVPVS